MFLKRSDRFRRWPEWAGSVLAAIALIVSIAAMLPAPSFAVGDESEIGIARGSDADPGAADARAVTGTSCLERFYRKSSATHTCYAVKASTSIAGETRNCILMAQCQRKYPLDMFSLRSGITVPFREVRDIANCDGVLTLGPCPHTWDGQGVLSVSDARTGESAGIPLLFMVTLYGMADHTVEVDYATSDGTASSGSDYSATSGTLTFGRHETAKAILVPVLDDGHDEPAETVMLTLSNPRNARIADPVATGTIQNGDPVPGAWIARFGRTVTGQVLDAMRGRLRARRRIGIRNAPAVLSSDAEGRTFVSGASPAMSGEAPDGGLLSVWGGGAVSGFDSKEDATALDGAVSTAFLGADYAAGRWLIGLALGHSRGTGGYGAGLCDGGSCAGRATASLTGIYPYAGFDLADRLSAWVAAGYGAGTFALDPGGEERIETGLTLAMGAAGMRTEILAPAAENGTALAATADARVTRISSDPARGQPGGGLAAADAEVWQLRAGVETSRRFALGTGATLAPSFEAGLRLDGGDAETGIGVELGGGLALADAPRGLTLDLRGRGLLVHGEPAFQAWDLAASLGWDPEPSSERGLSLSLRRRWEAVPAEGAAAAVGEGIPAAGLSNAGGFPFDAEDRLEAEVGYGLPVPGGRFVVTPRIGFGTGDRGRDYSLGWRFGPARSGDRKFELGLDVTRTEPERLRAEHRVRIGAAARW